MEKIVNIHEAKTHLSRLLNELRPGDTIVLAKMGKPIARIVPLQAEQDERPLGLRNLGNEISRASQVAGR